MRQSTERWFFWSILTLGLVLRLALALTNRLANDPHYEVWQIYLEAWSKFEDFPLSSSCRECFHPKLYYYFCAQIFHTFGIFETDLQIVLAQLVNVILVMSLLVLLAQWLKSFKLRSSVYLMVTAVLTFNPRLVAVSIQASNDMPVIFFSTVSALWFLKHLKSPNVTSALKTSFGLILTVVSKGNGLVSLVVTLLVTFCRFLIKATGRKATFDVLLIFFISLLIAASTYLLNPEFSRLESYFNRTLKEPGISTLHFDARPKVAWFERSIYDRPGVISIFDSFFTFRLISLLHNPLTEYQYHLGPLHQTSYWTQIYCRFHFTYCDQWPWFKKDAATRWLGRSIYLLALWPTLLILVGLLQTLKEISQRLITKDLAGIFSSQETFCTLLGLGYLGLGIIFSLEFRDISAMKDIYILPGLLGFLLWYLRGLDVVAKVEIHVPGLHRINLGLHAVLIVLYTTNSLMLLNQLT